LGGEVRKLKVLLCYNYQNGIIDEKYSMFAPEPKFFSIGTISLPGIIWSVETINVEIMDSSDKTSNSKLKSRVQITKQKTTNNRYEPKVALEDKVYLETHYNHQPRSVTMDEIQQK
jgi:hypothetical protein